MLFQKRLYFFLELPLTVLEYQGKFKEKKSKLKITISLPAKEVVIM